MKAPPDSYLGGVFAAEYPNVVANPLRTSGFSPPFTRPADFMSGGLLRFSFSVHDHELVNGNRRDSMGIVLRRMQQNSITPGGTQSGENSNAAPHLELVKIPIITG